jgi:hypothetical protein
LSEEFGNVVAIHKSDCCRECGEIQALGVRALCAALDGQFFPVRMIGCLALF